MDIDRILSELKGERDRIGQAIDALLKGTELITSSNGTRPQRGRPPGRSKGMSAVARKRMSEMMKARWAARRSKTAATVARDTAPQHKRRGGISAAGRKRLAEAMRKRWAEKRKANTRAGTERKS